MNREIRVTGKTIDLLRYCLTAGLREGIHPSDLEYFLDVRELIEVLEMVNVSGGELEYNPFILNVKG